MSFSTVAPGQFTKIALASGFTAEFISIDHDGPKFEKIDTTCLASTVKTYIQSPIYEAGEIKGKVHFNPDARPTLGGTASTDTVTIYYPSVGTATADTQRSRMACSGFLLSLADQIAVSPKLMEGDIVICLTGAPTFTATS